VKFTQIIYKKVFEPYSSKFEKRRIKLIKSSFTFNSNDKILDFGGYDGRRMVHLFPDKTDGIFIADISEKGLDIAKTVYGFETILLDESGTIPFKDNFFDFLFCNSVIEHVTVDKNEVYNFTSNKEFKNISFIRQKKLAEEIKRVSKKYFIQTPNKHFIIESHLWVPSFYLYLPRLIQIKIIRFLNKHWIKQSSPDFSLLTEKEMKELFSEAQIFKEKSIFLTKSLIAIKN
jgi:ubiquinone/menaquinone biosynthesis C-methylase UbiE